jgi:hypothetical protein
MAVGQAADIHAVRSLHTVHAIITRTATVGRQKSSDLEEVVEV